MVDENVPHMTDVDIGCLGKQPIQQDHFVETLYDVLSEDASTYIENPKQMGRFDYKRRKSKSNQGNEEHLKQKSYNKKKNNKNLNKTKTNKHKCKNRCNKSDKCEDNVEILYNNESDVGVVTHSLDAESIAEDSTLGSIFESITDNDGKRTFDAISDCLIIWYASMKQTMVNKNIGILLMMLKCQLNIPMTEFFRKGMFGPDGPFSKFNSMTLEQLRNYADEIYQDWTLAKSNSAFGHIWRFLTGLFAVVYSAISGKELSHGLFMDLMSKGASIGQNAKDFMTAAVETIVYLIKSITGYSRTRSVKSFLHKENPVLEYRNLCAELAARRIEFRRGVLKDIATYESDVLDAIAIGTEISKITYAAELTIVLGQRNKLMEAHAEITAQRQETGLRPSTFCVLVTSPSSYAKSTVMEMSGRVALQSIEAPSTSEYAYTWPRHKHWNGFKSFMQLIRADDMYCSTDKEDLKLEKDLLMRANNNAAFKPEMADLAAKENTFFDAKVLVGSANAYVTATSELCKVANMRRWHVLANLNVKDDFRQDGTSKVDPAKLALHGPIPDAWTVDLYKVKVTKVQEKIDPNRPEQQEDAQFVLLEHNGKIMKDISIREYLLFLAEETRRHFKIQKSVLAYLSAFDKEDIIDADLNIREDALREAYEKALEESEEMSPAERTELINIVDNKEEVSVIGESKDERDKITTEVASALKDVLINGHNAVEAYRTFFLRVFGEGAKAFLEGTSKALEYWVQRNKHFICALMIPQLCENTMVGEAMVKEIYRKRIQAYKWTTRAIACVPLMVGINQYIRYKKDLNPRRGTLQCTFDDLKMKLQWTIVDHIQGKHYENIPTREKVKFNYRHYVKYPLRDLIDKLTLDHEPEFLDLGPAVRSLKDNLQFSLVNHVDTANTYDMPMRQWRKYLFANRVKLPCLAFSNFVSARRVPIIIGSFCLNRTVDMLAQFHIQLDYAFGWLRNVMHKDRDINRMHTASIYRDICRDDESKLVASGSEYMFPDVLPYWQSKKDLVLAFQPARAVCKWIGYARDPVKLFSNMSLWYSLYLGSPECVIQDVVNFIVNAFGVATAAAIQIGSMRYGMPYVGVSLIGLYKVTRTDDHFARVLSKSMVPVADSIRSRYGFASNVLYTTGAALTFSDVLATYEKMWEATQVKQEMSVSDVAAEDEKKGQDTKWTQDKDQVERTLDPIPSVPRTVQELKNAIENSCWHVTRKHGNKKSELKAFAVKTGLVVVPHHFIADMQSDEEWTFLMHDRGGIGDRSFTNTISKACCFRFYVEVEYNGHTVRKLLDLTLVALSTAITISTAILDCFLDELPSTIPAFLDMYGRSKEGKLIPSVATDSQLQEVHSFQKEVYDGVTYRWPLAGPGQCTTVICPASNQTAILGFHVGTYDEKDGRSIGVVVTKKTILSVIARAEKSNMMVFQHAATGDMPVKVNDTIIVNPEIKLKSSMARVKRSFGAAFLGSSERPNRKQKTKIRRHMSYSDIKEGFDAPDYGGPDFNQGKGTNARLWDGLLDQVPSSNAGLPREDLVGAYEEVRDKMMAPACENPQEWAKLCRLISTDETINGADDLRYYDSLNWQTSAGIGFPGKKGDWVLREELLPNGRLRKILHQSAIDRRNKIFGFWDKKQCAHPVYNVGLKDEATPVGKKKVRPIQAGDLGTLLAYKQVFAPAVRYLQLNKDITGITVGMNPYSQEWEDTFKYMDEVGHGNYMSFDYKSFDLHVTPLEISLFGQFVVDLYTKLGFDEVWIQRVKSAITDLCNPIIDWNGDILIMLLLASGTYLTSCLGSFVNILRLVAAFRRICKTDAMGNIMWAVQGDDNVTKVNWYYTNFNAVSVYNYFKEYGIPITSADKKSAIKPYVNFWELSFLKRTPRYCNLRCRKVGMLERNSISKRLMVLIHTNGDYREVWGQNADGALMEYSLWPRAEFEKAKKIIVATAKKYHYEPFCHNLDKGYTWYVNNGPTQIDASKYDSIVSRIMDTSSLFSADALRGLFGPGDKKAQEMKPGTRPSANPSPKGYAGQDGKNDLATNNEKHKYNALAFGRVPSQEKAKENSRDIREIPVRLESKTVENLQFMDNEPVNSMDLRPGSDGTRTSRDNDLASLGEFLSRPLKIADFEYSTSTNFFERFDPWSAFCENPRVSNRISNFKNMKGDLVVKILMNGNSFYYGRLLCSYQPLEVFDFMTANAGLVKEDLIQMSQFPSIRLNPTVSQTGEMRLPFLYMKDFVDIANGEWDQLGKITIRQINQLQHTSGEVSVSNTLPITVYAYMENVTLVGLTSANAASVTAQMDERDESEDGPVTKIASAVSKAAGALESVPTIGKYAMPARVGADIVGRVAKANGWSAPSNVKSNHIVEPRGAGHTAVTDACDTAMKLTIDSKQETTIDPSVFGISSGDELNIKKIGSTESYLTTFDWTHGTSVDTMLWNARVDPCIHDRLAPTDTGRDTYFLPACAGVTIPFKYWTGSMKFRFEVVRSAFHKGRLAVLYDPTGTPASREDNVNQVQIVDISTSEDFSVTLEPMQNVGPMEHIDPSVYTADQMFGTTRIVNPARGNGTVSIWVINPLTLPNEPSTTATGIKVNVYVSCEDLELYAPHALYAFTTVKPEMNTYIDPDFDYSSYGSGQALKAIEEAKDKDELVRARRYARWLDRRIKARMRLLDHNVRPEMNTDVSEPVEGEANHETDLGSFRKDLHFDQVYFGESIESVRALLKRYCAYFLQRIPGGDDLTQHCIELNGFPLYRGNMGASSIHTTAALGKYNYVSTTLINYYAPAFQVKKGSLRYKALIRGGDASDQAPTSATVSVNYAGTYGNEVIDLSGTTDSQVAYAGSNALANYPRASGTALFTPRVNPVLEFEVPWYSQWRFEPGKRTNYMSQPYNDIPTFPGFTIAIDNDNFNDSGLELFVAAGEDFTLNLFTGWPRMYLNAPPVPQ